MRTDRLAVRLTIFAFCAIVGIWQLAGQAYAGCRNPNVAEEDASIKRIAALGPIQIRWFGHSFFQITSSSGTRIITDPFGAMGFPMPEVWPHVVTVGREHGNHNNVGLAKGNPVVIRGLKEGGSDWNQVNTTFRDVLIYNVPVHQRGIPGYLSLRGSGFPPAAPTQDAGRTPARAAPSRRRR